MGLSIPAGPALRGGTGSREAACAGNEEVERGGGGLRLLGSRYHRKGKGGGVSNPSGEEEKRLSAQRESFLVGRLKRMVRLPQ